MLKSGAVNVRGEIRHVWRLRNFSLTPDLLQYTDERGAQSNIRRVQILHCRPYSDSEQAHKKSSLPSGTHGFIVYGIHSGYSRIYHCSVDSKEEMEAWVKLIRGVAIRGGKGWTPNKCDTTASVYNFQVNRRRVKHEKSSTAWKKATTTLNVGVEYKINVVNNKGGMMGSWTLVRRFSDFGKLIHELKLEFSTPVNSFPSVINSVSNMYDHENNFIGGVSAIHGIKKRITILNEILKHLLNDEKVSSSEKLRIFLLPEDTNSTSPNNDNNAPSSSLTAPSPSSRHRQSVAQFAKSMFLPTTDSSHSPSSPNNSSNSSSDSEWVVLDKSSSSAHHLFTNTQFIAPLLVAALAITLRTYTTSITITMSSDVLVLLVFSIFALGVHAGSRFPPSPSSFAARSSNLPTPTHSHSHSTSSTMTEIERRSSILALPQDALRDSPNTKSPPTLAGFGSPLPLFPSDGTCYSSPDASVFRVRGPTYKADKVKVPSEPGFNLRGLDLFITDNAMHDIGRHPSVLGGKVKDCSTFIVNFLLPWGNLVACWEIPQVDLQSKGFGKAWKHFINGSQKERDAKLKLLPVCVEGPWIVRKTVGPGNAPAVVGKAMPIEYYEKGERGKPGHYFECDLVIISSAVARGILSVVKSHCKSIVMDIAFILEGAKENELPEQVLGAFRVHNIDPVRCSVLPPFEEGEEGDDSDGERRGTMGRE